MIERIDVMPAGTIGFRASGRLTRDDYRDVLEPALGAAAETGEIRMLFEVTDFKGVEPAAGYEDLKLGLDLGWGHRSAWKRSAIVTDLEWLAKGFEFFAWVAPGEVKVFGLDRFAEAQDWLSR
jgi:hypothetical protein